jgi:hypothetical protein
MSLYQVNKVLREVSHDQHQAQRFLEDSASYLAGRDLTTEERRALVERDYAALYALGAHPFLLWGWTHHVHGADMRSLAQSYVDAIAPYGRPDFAT